jgi:hypothetical protein
LVIEASEKVGTRCSISEFETIRIL